MLFASKPFTALAAHVPPAAVLVVAPAAYLLTPLLAGSWLVKAPLVAAWTPPEVKPVAPAPAPVVAPAKPIEPAKPIQKAAPPRFSPKPASEPMAATVATPAAVVVRRPRRRLPAFNDGAHGEGLLVPQSLHGGGNVGGRSAPRRCDPRAVIGADRRQFAADKFPCGLARGARPLP